MVLEGPSTRDTPCGDRERGATHSELQNEPRQGCSYTVERDRGGCSVCPTKLPVDFLGVLECFLLILQVHFQYEE